MNDFGTLIVDTEADEHEGRFYGVATAVVTNNQDPDGLGRVKLRFLWLSDEHESAWTRVAVPMAGQQRGLYFLPEVDDEVLVAFEHGRIEYPFVLGAMWNGKDQPPETNDDGKNAKRTIKSRSGHVIRLDDSEGKEKIEIIAASGNQNRIVIDSAQQTVTIMADADIVIESSSGAITLSGSEIKILSRSTVAIEAGSDMNLKANGNVNANGATINLN